MGYSTDFNGEIRLNKPVDEETKVLLDGLHDTRRMARNADPKYGVEGEFYIEDMTVLREWRNIAADIIDHNRPPSTQPGLNLQWQLTEDRQGIEWDGGEKFYEYIDWLVYLRDKVLRPRGYEMVDGEIEWFGEDREDTGAIIANFDGTLTIKITQKPIFKTAEIR